MQTDEPTEYPVLSLESPPEGKERALPDPLADLRAQLEHLHRAGTDQFQSKLKAKGGAVAWLTSRAPLAHRRLLELAADVGSSSDDPLGEIIESETESFWSGVETRLSECQRCPPWGGACEGSTDRFAPGVLVQLRFSEALQKVGGVFYPIAEESSCDRYQDFRMARRLERAGLNRRLCQVKLHSIGREPSPEVVGAFEGFLDAGMHREAPEAIELVIEGQLAREYGAALLRSTMRSFPNATYGAVNVPTLIRACKDAMTTKRASALSEHTLPQVLLLDGVDRDFLQRESKWGVGELQWLYNKRRDDGLATIVTALCKTEEAFPGARVLRV